MLNNSNIINCKECGNFFQWAYGPKTCPACTKRMEDVFTQVKDFIYDNPGCTMQMVVENFDVKVEQIKQWVREERLSFSDDSQVGLNCEGCGTMIKSGRFCPNCKNTCINGFQKITAKNQPKKPEPAEKKNGTKMYTK